MSAIFNIGYWVFAKAAFVLSYIASWILGVFIAISAFLVGVALDLNTKVAASTFVTTGFNVTLSLANLGFVIGMVVMAIMTIVRYQPYGVKQMLWRIVVMAIVVNFGLVIVGPILGIANSLTMYWLESTNPAGSGSSFNNFASSLAGAFNPQTSFTETAAVNFESSDIAGNAGAGIAQLLQPIASVIITVFTLLLINVALITFAVMLIVRFVMLSLLLVILPLAWVSWVFPLTRGNWEKWWHAFLNQTFFAPIVVFFIWLVITTGKQMGGLDAINVEVYSSSNPFGSFLGSLIKGLVGPFAQGAVFAGLTIGGLIISQSMGIKFASAGVSAAQGMGKAFGGYVGRRATSAGRAAAQKDIRIPFTQKRIPSLQKGVSTLQTSRIPGVSAIGRAGQNLIERGGKNIVTNLRSEADNKDPVRIATELKGYMDKDKQIAYLLASLKKDGVGFVQKVGNQDIKGFLAKNKEEFAKRGFAKEFIDLEKATGSSAKMTEKQQAVTDAAKTGGGRAYYEANEKVLAAQGKLHEAEMGTSAAKKRMDDAENAKEVKELQTIPTKIASAEKELESARTTGDLAKIAEKQKGVDALRARETELKGSDAVKLLEKTEAEWRAADLSRGNAERELETAERNRSVTTSGTGAAAEEAQRMEQAMEDFNTAVKEFAGTLNKADVGRVELNTLYKKFDAKEPQFGAANEEQHRESQKTFARTIAADPSLASSALGKMRGEQRDRFSKDYVEALRTRIARAEPAEKEATRAEVDEALRAFNNSVYGNLVGYISAEQATPAPTPAAPATPPPRATGSTP